MTPTQRKAMEQALEALRLNQAARPFAYRKAITALRTALAEQPAEQAQVALHQFHKRGCADWYDGLPDHEDGGGPYETRTLYTAPQPAKRVPLTDDEIEEINGSLAGRRDLARLFARAVIAAYDAKNGITGETQ